MRNPLQDQLLKAGLVKKSQVAQVARDQVKQRHGKAPAVPQGEHVDAARLQAERVERDRALAAERNAQARDNELRAQVRQIVDTSKVKRSGDIEYRFTDGAVIRSVLVNEALRAQLAGGSLVVVRHGDGYELVPRSVAEKVRTRDAGAIVLDHGIPGAPADGADDDDDDDDEHYRKFQVPDDLVW